MGHSHPLILSIITHITPHPSPLSLSHLSLSLSDLSHSLSLSLSLSLPVNPQSTFPINHLFFKIQKPLPPLHSPTSLFFPDQTSHILTFVIFVHFSLSLSISLSLSQKQQAFFSPLCLCTTVFLIAISPPSCCCFLTSVSCL
jgi:hypothetical protein